MKTQVVSFQSIHILLAGKVCVYAWLFVKQQYNDAIEFQEKSEPQAVHNFCVKYKHCSKTA